MSVCRSISYVYSDGFSDCMLTVLVYLLHVLLCSMNNTIEFLVTIDENLL